LQVFNEPARRIRLTVGSNISAGKLVMEWFDADPLEDK